MNSTNQSCIMLHEMPKRMHLDASSDMDGGAGDVQMMRGDEPTNIAAAKIAIFRAPSAPDILPPSTPYKHLPAFNNEDWNYTMRREMQEIVPGLFLGPWAAASKSKLCKLKSNGITHVVCVRHYSERDVVCPVHEHQLNYLVLEIGDANSVSLIPYCNRVKTYVDSCFEAGGSVLVHGNLGLNRSAALVTGYIMATYGVSLEKALSFVQSKRFAANPNGWLMQQLKEYEAIYQAMHDFSQVRESTRSTIQKREFDKISVDMDENDTEMTEFDNDQDLNMD